VGLAEGVQDAHEDLAGLGPPVGLGAEAELARNDRGPEFPFAAVVVGRDLTIRDPVVEPVGALVEDILDVTCRDFLPRRKRFFAD
jgi:hypothetical protein